MIMGQYEILLVDDDPLILKMTDEFLKSQGYDITAVSDGASAIEVTDQKILIWYSRIWSWSQLTD